MPPEKSRVIISYSHADAKLLKNFLPFLKTLQNGGLVTAWSDHDIKPGVDWPKEITQKLSEANIAVLLISQNFLASDFIRTEELPLILNAYEKGTLTILPVFLSPSDASATAIPFTDSQGNARSFTLTNIHGYGTPEKTLEHMLPVEQKETFKALNQRIRELATPPPPNPTPQSVPDSSPGMDAGANATVNAVQGDDKPGSEIISIKADKEPVARHHNVSTATQRILEPLPGLRLLPVPGGTFTMGDDHGKHASEKPAHPLELSSFWLAETPVTNRHYALFLQLTKHPEPAYYWQNQKYSDPDQPVVGVAWSDAEAFCTWLTQKSGKQILLPSEAQWEYAARGTDGRRYPWDHAEPTKELACFGLDSSKGKPSLVGQYPAGKGPFGHLDLAGNVWEWCRDVWDGKAYKKRAGKSAEIKDPVVNTGDQERRSVRGGSWHGPAVILRAAFRGVYSAGIRGDDLGFRLAAPASTLGP
ncbi:MAG: SUMF1/EgtB/PvdO family nonheme iron enzyme [Magnetococcales bacterium]|nr:SUMF1/EgtB/PvdO family nonheme iron enzyme [Magnetococcales bacterium]